MKGRTVETQRIELKNGEWAEISRGMKVADLRAQRNAVHERGYEDNILDGLALVRRKITAWSLGDISDEAIDSLDLDDAQTLINAINGSDDDSPNSLSTSPDGTPVPTPESP